MLKNYYFIFILIFFFFLFVLFPYFSFSQSCPTCKLNGWQYEAEITLDNSAVAVSSTNYQELIFVDTQTPIGLGKMNFAGSDIRFLDSDCSTPLCYYIESGMNSVNTKIWLLLPSLPANTTKTIYLFYGNSSAPAGTNFNCVFPNVLTVTGTVTLSGNQTYDWIDIQPGSTINIGAGQVLSFKAGKISMAGIINGNAAGFGPASGPGAGGNGGGSDGGGGGGYGGTGGSGKCPGPWAGASYGTANGTDINMGSGGGGSDCGASAAGGGAVSFEATVIDMTGNISVNGQTAAYCPGGNSSEAAGGGSGGGILIKGDYVNGSGTLNANGGNGGGSGGKEGGGGGAGGRIKIFYCKTNNYSGTANVAKGTPGSPSPQCSANDAQNGTSTVNTYTCEAITTGPELYTVVADAGPDLNYCSGSTMTIGSPPLAGYTYSWSPIANLSSSTVANPTVIIINNGTSNIVTDYVVTATNNGCSVTDTVRVTVFPLPTSIFSATGPVCVAESAFISYTGNAGAGATYLWDFDGGTVVSGSGQGPYLISWPVSGTKNITLTVLQNGCLSSTTTVITMVNPPDADAGADVSFCSGGGSATIGTTATAGFTYSWLPVTGLSDPAAANPTVTLTNTGAAPVTTDYIVTTLFAGCSVSDTVAVTVNPEPVSAAGNDVDFCSGSSVVIGTTVNTNYSYSWTPPGGLSSSTVSDPAVSLTHTGTVPLVVTYIVTTTFTAYGCITSDTMDVTVYQVPTSDFTAPPDICENQTATITYTGNATTAANYTWSFGGGSASPGTGQGPHSVVWISAAAVNITLLVTENNCSSSITSSQVIVKPSPIPDAGPDVTFCSGSGAFIGTAGTAGYSYSWNPTTGLSNDTVSDPFVVLADTSFIPATITYYVTTTLTGCVLIDSVNVTVNPLPVSDAGADVSFCSGSSADIGTAPTTGYTYSWSPVNGLNLLTASAPTDSLTNETVSPILTTYTVITTYYGCTTSDSVIVTVNPLPVSDAGADVNFCSEGSAAIGSPPTSGYTYLWTPLTGLSSNILSDPVITLTNSTDTVQQFNYAVTSTQFNCSTTDTVGVIVYPIPFSFFTPPAGQCLKNNNFAFSGNGVFLPLAASLSWDFGVNATPQSATVQNPSGIIFSTPDTQFVSFTITQFGCTSNTAIRMVAVYPMPLISYSTNLISGCQPLDVIFTDNSTSTPPASYLWEFGNGMTSDSKSPGYLYLSDGTFNVTVTITSGNGCITQDAAMNITVWSKPQALFSYSPEEPTELFPKVYFTDESYSSITGWDWDFGDGDSLAISDPSHFYPDTGTYCVTLIVTTSDGCKDTFVQCLRVLPDYILHLPNAFTPNDDAVNDYFFPVFMGVNANEFELVIFNRWGGIVYRSKDPGNSWNGNFPDGTPAQEDVYVWTIRVKDVLDRGHYYVGHVALVR